jgi:hypothetical protein
MSGGAFDYAYFAIEEGVRVALVRLDEILAWCEGERGKEYIDSEAIKVVKDFRSKANTLWEESQRMNDLLHDIEWVASNDYGPDAVKESLEKYLKAKREAAMAEKEVER